MTSALMLSRLRTLLDESSAGFWTDNECYYALSDGQREVVNVIFKNNPNSQLLKALFMPKSGTDTSSSAITLPSDFKEFVVASYTTVTTEDQYPCKIVVYDDFFLREKNNTYLAPSRANPVVYVKPDTTIGRKIYFEPTSSHADYSIVYLTEPTEISSSINPLLPAEAQEAIIIYAFSFLLRKDLRATEADGAYKLFLDMVGKL